MAGPSEPLLRVTDWNERYENNRSRGMKNTHWFPMPNDLSADSYVELLAHPDGPAHLGVWTALLMVASRAKPRGTLVRADCRPHDSESLARVMRQPESVVSATIERLLQIGLLETDAGKPSRKSRLRRHPSAPHPHRTAAASQHSAAEQKGTEHHHQEGNGTETKRTERADVDRNPERPSAVSAAALQISVDDEAFASPEDELKAIYLAKARRPITIAVLDAVRLSLEVKAVSMDDFVRELRGHVHGRWLNPAGFIRDLAQRFHAKTVLASAPISAAESEELNYSCPTCGSDRRGEGALLVDGREVPCSCADPDWIAKKRARGFFKDEAAEAKDVGA